MSGGAIYQEGLRFLGRQQLPRSTQRELLSVLEACRRGVVDFLFEAGTDAELPLRELLYRAAAILFCACAVNLADDLSDNECTYLRDPSRTGPVLQALLYTMFIRLTGQSSVRSSTLAAALRDLTRSAGAQHTEVCTRRWTAPRFRRVANGIGGRLFSAYLRLLWDNTRLAGRAVQVGQYLGRVVLVSEDMGGPDRRYLALPEEDKRAVESWALAAVEMLRAEGLRCLDLVLLTLEPRLRSGGNPPPDRTRPRRAIRGAPAAPSNSPVGEL
jgi:hypothetical protein